MTNTSEFFVRVCGCGVVHLSFGCTIVNVSPEAAIAISETLREVATELKKRIPAATPDQSSGTPQEPRDNIIVGNFPITN